MKNPKLPNVSSTDEQASDRLARERSADGGRESVAVPSNTATNNSNSIGFEGVCLRYGIDSLYLSYQGDLFDHVDRELSHLKKLAQSDNPSQHAKAQLKLGEHLFEVKDKGTSMFAYILEDNAFRIQLSRPKKSVPMAYVKVSSEYLCHKLPRDVEKVIKGILDQLGNVQSFANVSRIDMYVDFATHQPMDAWGREAWVTRAASIVSYAENGRFTGWGIGIGSSIGCRLYDKLYEITKSNKGYLVPLWESSGWLGDMPVHRLEFELKRELLQQLGLYQLNDVLDNLNGLWSYGTTEWLKLTIPNANDETRSRWPIHPMWQWLSSIDWETSGGALTRTFSNQRIPEESRVLHRALSCVTTWMALKGITDYELAIHPFYEALNTYINNYGCNVGLGFDGVIHEQVAKKARVFNTIDVNAEIYAAYVDEEVAAYRKQSDGE